MGDDWHFNQSACPENSRVGTYCVNLIKLEKCHRQIIISKVTKFGDVLNNEVS